MVCTSPTPCSHFGSIGSIAYDASLRQGMCLTISVTKSDQNMNTLEGKVEYVEKMAAGVFDCKYVESVYWRRLKDSDIVEVSPVRTGYYTTLNSKDVLNCIEKKENKLLRYRCQKENQDISEYWLFICNPSNTFCDLEDFEMPDFESSFDRIYITDIRRVLQLK